MHIDGCSKLKAMHLIIGFKSSVNQKPFILGLVEPSVIVVQEHGCMAYACCIHTAVTGEK